MKTPKSLLNIFFVILLFSQLHYTQIFNETDVQIPGFTKGNIVWGDFNNDGFLDILIAGGPYPWSGRTEIYKNNGNGTFTKMNTSYLIPLSNGSGAWVDVNNDGYLDIIISGYYQLLSRPVTKVYINNNGQSFTEVPNDITGFYYSSIAAADFDNNGTLDFVISGLDRDFEPTTKLYRNSGNGQFELVPANFKGVFNSTAAWGDINNNGKLDLIIAGSDNIDNNINRPVTLIYRNDGEGVFTEIETDIAGIQYGSLSWGDYDNDGFLDLLVTGDRRFEYFGFEAAYTAIYKNMGDETFVKQDIPLQRMINSTALWADLDNDGSIDIILSGSAGALGIQPFTKIYLNDGSGNFTPTDDSLKQLAISVAALGDFNNNNRLDLILAGYDQEGLTYKTILYENVSPVENTKPSIPNGLTEEISDKSVTLMWNESTDNETDSKSLTYNIRVGTSPGASDIYSSMSLQSNGLRLIPVHGNTNHNTSWSVHGLSEGEYYWSVQAVDNGLLASEFAAEKSFTIQSPTSVDSEIIPAEFALLQNYPNPFNPSTVISYNLPSSSFVTLKVYNILGNEVAALVNELQQPGNYNVTFSAIGRDRNKLTSGVYIYKLTAGDFVQTRKMILIK